MHDVDKRMECNISDMLKAFLALMLSNDETAAPSDEHKKEAAKAYEALLVKTTAFCNADSSKNAGSLHRETCVDMKKALKEYCALTDEKKRCLPLTTTINAIILAFANDRSIASLEVKSPGVFVRNDPIIIRSAHLDKVYKNSESKRKKPDIIYLLESTMKTFLDDDGPLTLQKCVEWAAGQAKHPERDFPVNWTHVVQSWELKASSLLHHGRLDQVYEPSPDSSQGLGTLSKKRPATPARTPSHSKRRRVDVEATTKEEKTEISDGKLWHDGQLAFYALERLHCSWRVSHTIGVLLQDARLQLWWYDAQGCIATEDINIIEELPLFVAMIVLFQRFPSFLWGLIPETIPLKTRDGEYLVDSSTPLGHFQLRGRRTFTSSLGKSSTPSSPEASVASDPSPCQKPAFFKSSWPEVSRVPVADIIAVAKRRADALLPEPFRTFVLDRLPSVLGSGHFRLMSTAVIRDLVGLSVEGERKQAWVISESLVALPTQTPKVMWECVWELVKCHQILWQIGIAHGDISLNNLMFNTLTKKAILNDFDLAAIMTLGADGPPKTGFECTGTKPFMALDLLRGSGPYRDVGGVHRTYRHDLESFFWVLIALVCCVVDGKADLKRPPLGDWLTGSFATVYEKKWTFLGNSANILKLQVPTPWNKSHHKDLLPLAFYWIRFYQDQGFRDALKAAENTKSEEGAGQTEGGKGEEDGKFGGRDNKGDDDEGDEDEDDESGETREGDESDKGDDISTLFSGIIQQYATVRCKLPGVLQQLDWVKIELKNISEEESKELGLMEQE